MRHRSRRPPHRATPGSMVRRRYRPERLANEKRCCELSAAGEHGAGISAQTESIIRFLDKSCLYLTRFATPRLAFMQKKPVGPKIPLLAYASLYRDPIGYLTRAARKYGDVMQVEIGRRHDFLLNHPD